MSNLTDALDALNKKPKEEWSAIEEIVKYEGIIAALEAKNAELDKALTAAIKELGETARKLGYSEQKNAELVAELKNAEEAISDLITTESRLVADNALLRKRLEPIKNWWNTRDDDRQSGMYQAIRRCMEMKEAE